MDLFQLILKGYDAEDRNAKLVKWVLAAGPANVSEWLAIVGLGDLVVDMTRHPHKGLPTFADGVDVMLDRVPEPDKEFCRQYARGLWQHSVEPQDWLKDVADAERFPVRDWRMEVTNGDTRLGYEEWLAAKLEEEEDEEPGVEIKGRHTIAEWNAALEKVCRETEINRQAQGDATWQPAQTVAVQIGEDTVYDLKRIGGVYPFEYHASPTSDPVILEMQNRSGQKATALRLGDCDPPYWDTFEARKYHGGQITYRVRFEDGHEGEAFEDELLVDEPQTETIDEPQLPPHLADLKPGDRLTWNDPDGGKCSRIDQPIRGIQPFGDENVLVIFEDGGEVEGPVSEFSRGPYEVWVVAGSNGWLSGQEERPEPDRYAFATAAEKAAFLQGIAACDGYTDVSGYDEKQDAENHIREARGENDDSTEEDEDE